MMYPIEIIPGTERNRIDRAAWATLRELTNGDWLLTAETTQVYYRQSDEIPVAFATEGHMLPRDDSILLRITEASRPFHYYIPAGGSLRVVKVKVHYPTLAVRPIDERDRLETE